MSKQVSIFDTINESAANNYEKVARRMRTAAEIAEALEKNGLSKAEFARKIGQRQSVITKWLSGTHNFTTDTLAEISKVLNIEITGCDLANMSDRNNLTTEELKKIRQHDFSNDPNFTNIETLFASQYGEKGTQSREDFEAKAKAWYYAEILREKRKELKITQKELAERIGRERTYINRIEKGETDIQLSTFLRIANALGIDISLNMRLA